MEDFEKLYIHLTLKIININYGNIQKTKYQIKKLIGFYYDVKEILV